MEKMMYVMKDTKTFEVLAINKEPEEGDKWEDKMCIYTINNVERLYMEQLPLYTTRYYIVDVDVWVKDICTPDEPMRFMFKFDPEMEVSEEDIKKREEDILKNDIAIQEEWERQDEE